MKRLRYAAFALLICVAAPQAGFTQTTGVEDTAARTSRVESYLEELEKVGFSGSVLIEINGNKTISRGFGYRDLEEELRNTPDTVFDIGSVAKQFTAAAILKLEMQGKLTTDDKLPGYFDNVPDDKAGITIHQLLRHSSGLPSVVGGDYDKITESVFIEKALSSPLSFEAGARFSYSNVGYSLLGLIVEKASGKGYEEFLYENLWRPATMESTGYGRPNFAPDMIAVGYAGDERWGKPTDKEWDGDGPYWHLKGNGGILSTVEDLYKWNLALRSDEILSKAAKEKYYRPKLRDNENDNPYYAYGWDVLRTPRNTILTNHNGTNRIFYADFFRYLDERVTIVVLSNKEHENFRQINREISRIIFEPAFEPVIPVADNAANRRFTDEIIGTLLTQGPATAIEAYRKREPALNLLESVVNGMGYKLLSEQNSEQAIEIFSFNVLVFPRSSNAFDSLGEAYLEAGNTVLAIENYTKGLLLNPDNRRAEEMLIKLAN